MRNESANKKKDPNKGCCSRPEATHDDAKKGEKKVVVEKQAKKANVIEAASARPFQGLVVGPQMERTVVRVGKSPSKLGCPVCFKQKEWPVAIIGIHLKRGN